MNRRVTAAVVCLLIVAAGACSAGGTAGESAASSPAASASSTVASSEAPSDTPSTSGAAAAPAETTAPPSSTRPPLGDPPDAGPAPEGHTLPAEVLEGAVRSSVVLYGRACGRARVGSGFAVLDGDHMATNAHVLFGVTEPTVRFADGRELPGRVVAFDAVNDLAVVHTPGAGLEPLRLVGEAADGTTGAVLGWAGDPPDDFTAEPVPFRIDRPVIVRTNEEGGDERVNRNAWLLAAPIEQGHSGAAMVALAPLEGDDADGSDPAGTHSAGVNAVGVVWGTSRRSDSDTAYATRADELQELLLSADLSATAELPDCR